MYNISFDHINNQFTKSASRVIGFLPSHGPYSIEIGDYIN